MPFLIEIKKKIGAVQNTRKITKAMELVAASRMRQFQHKALGTRAYAWSLLDVLKASQANWRGSPFTHERKEGKVMFILLTSDKGLAGPLNHQLVRSLWRSDSWKACTPQERLLITIGRKSLEAALQAGVEPVQRFEGVNERLNPLQALEIINVILGYWEREECRQIILVSPHYVNPFLFHVTQKTYLPLSQAMIETHLEWRDKTQKSEQQLLFEKIIYEPGPEELRDVLLLQVIQTLFLQAFYELKATEYSSRMVAMKHATEAADEVTHELTRTYHKARQTAITQQLAELAGGNIENED